METKRCVMCGEVKPVSEFYVKRRTEQGKTHYMSYCKPCFSQRTNHHDRAAPSAYKRPVMTPEERRQRRNAQSREYTKRNGYIAQQQYKEKYPDRVRANARRSYERHIERIAVRDKQWRADNPERTRDIYRRWRRKHLDVANARVQRRRARILNAIGAYTLEQWDAVKIAQDYTCLMCGQKEPDIKLTVDHIIPLSKGGSNMIDNIQGLCLSCNCKKHTQTIDLRTGME